MEQGGRRASQKIENNVSLVVARIYFSFSLAHLLHGFHRAVLLLQLDRFDPHRTLSRVE